MGVSLFLIQPVSCDEAALRPWIPLQCWGTNPAEQRRQEGRDRWVAKGAEGEWSLGRRHVGECGSFLSSSCAPSLQTLATGLLRLSFSLFATTPHPSSLSLASLCAALCSKCNSALISSHQHRGKYYFKLFSSGSCRVVNSGLERVLGLNLSQV